MGKYLGPLSPMPGLADYCQFCGANVDRVIDALPGTWSETRPKKYSPTTAGEYVNMRLNATYK